MNLSKKVTGYLLGIVAAAAYGMNPLFALPLYADGMNSDSVLFFRYLFALPILAMMIVWRRRSFAITRRNAVELAAMGVLMALSSLGLFESYRHMDAGIASTLLFIYPLMVAVIMTFVFHEKLSLLTGACIAATLLGIGMLYQNDGTASISLTGTALVFVSALTYAIYIVYISRSKLNAVPTVIVTFYVLLFGSMVFAVRLLAGEPVTVPQSPLLWGNAVALALFPTALSLLCTTRAIQYIGSTTTAILGALEPVTAVFFGVTIFGETLTLRTVCGMTVIIVAVTLVVADKKVSSWLLRLRRMFPRLPRRHS